MSSIASVACEDVRSDLQSSFTNISRPQLALACVAAASPPSERPQQDYSKDTRRDKRRHLIQFDDALSTESSVLDSAYNFSM